MKLEEIDAKIAELAALRAEAIKVEEEKASVARFEEAVELFPTLVNTIRRLDELGYLPPRLVDVLTDTSGKVNPGQYLKRPRLPTKQHP